MKKGAQSSRKIRLLIAGVLGAVAGLFWGIISWAWLIITGLGALAQSQPVPISFIEKIIFLPVFTPSTCGLFFNPSHVTGASFLCVLVLPFIFSIGIGAVFGLSIYAVLHRKIDYVFQSGIDKN